MNIQDLKVGNPVEVMCSGMRVSGVVESISGICVKVKHEPVRWGNDYFIQTNVLPPTQFQRESHGNFAVPRCWKNGIRVAA